MGVYRLWRDLGYAAGALLAGVVADAIGMTSAINVVAGLTALSGFVVLFRLADDAAARGPVAESFVVRPLAGDR